MGIHIEGSCPDQECLRRVEASPVEVWKSRKPDCKGTRMFRMSMSILITGAELEAAEALLQLRYGSYGGQGPSTSRVNRVRHTRARRVRAAATARVQIRNASDEWQLPSWMSRKPDCKGTDLVPIGKGFAKVPRRLVEQLSSTYYTLATRNLLSAVFTREEMATHTLSGRPSPAFPNYPVKTRLDPRIIDDIVTTVMEHCCVHESIVRSAVTTKCADETKMFRNRHMKLKAKKENVPPSSSDSTDSSNGGGDDDEDSD